MYICFLTTSAIKHWFQGKNKNKNACKSKFSSEFRPALMLYSVVFEDFV